MSSPLNGLRRTIVFTQEHVDAFSALSYDRNPLHTDPTYARRTPFGSCVVHGVVGIIAAVRAVAGQGVLRIRSCECSFIGALYTDTEYQIETERRGENECVTVITRRGARKLHLVLHFDRLAVPPTSRRSGNWSPLLEPESPPLEHLSGLTLSGSYAVDASAYESGGDLYRCVTPQQLTCLAWVSFFCGMRVPGRQSLISKIKMIFRGDSAASMLRYEAQVLKYDARFGLVELGAALSDQSTLICKVSMTAFTRPAPVEFELDVVRAAVGESNHLAGKVALVTGGTRGLGANIAAGLALHGCAVAINHRMESPDADTLVRGIKDAGGRAMLVKGDVENEGDCVAMRNVLESHYGQLDYLVNNASPPILPNDILELSPSDVVRFVSRSLSAFITPTQSCLPMLARHSGTVISISSAYVTTPSPRFAHYVSAKAAIEGAVRGAAREFQNVRFMIVRPPKLHTDQTNVSFDREPRLHPAEIAGWIMNALKSASKPGEVILVAGPTASGLEA